MTSISTQASMFALAVAFAPVALGEPVEVEYLGSQGNTGRAVLVSLAGGLSFHDDSTTRMVWAGTRSFLLDGQHIRAYAAELTGINGNGTFEQLDAAEALGQSKAEALGALFAANNNGTTLSREQAVAFQALIWEIVYDFDGTAQSLDLTSGTVRMRMVNHTLFEHMASSVMHNRVSTLDVIANDDFNDTILVVPLPSTAALAGLGLGGLVAIRRRR